MNVPVLLIAFNRPDTTAIVFQKIREAKPNKLYVAVDGPRKEKLGEDILCQEVIDITKQIDWNCEAKYLIQEKNLGCGLGVTKAISWIFETEEMAIILEDDIVAVQSFFNFAEELLVKYKDEEKVAMISANNYTPDYSMTEDYVFTKYGHIWGWATWKRVWDKFDINVPYIEDDLKNKKLKRNEISKQEYAYFKKYAQMILKSINNKTINTWDYQFAYFRISNNLLSIAPRVNLASNIGTASSRTDSVAKINKNYYPADESFILYNHPIRIECNFNYDKTHFKIHINKKTPLIKRIVRRLSKAFEKR